MVLVMVMVAANGPQQEKLDKDLRELAGKWLLVTIEMDGETDLPDDDDILLEITEDGRLLFEEEFRLTIDSSCKPKVMDLVPVENKRLQKIEAIYEVKKDTLRICAAFDPIPVPERPLAFDAKPGSKFEVWNLKRAKAK
ncbi:MAG: TIGR03067 domain-containing protein [Gemmataceae bacterium]|nr:TIGR03067 domain-containing protein [Gemmataceae bacterium]